MFLETKNAFGLVFIQADAVVSIVPADVREGKSGPTRLVNGSCVRTRDGEEIYVLDTPLDLFESITSFD